jgi:hypothetical protein
MPEPDIAADVATGRRARHGAITEDVDARHPGSDTFETSTTRIGLLMTTTDHDQGA